MNVITEEVDYAKIKEKESGPSCSLAEALENRICSLTPHWHISDVTYYGNVQGRKTLYRGAYVNLETLKVTAIPV